MAFAHRVAYLESFCCRGQLTAGLPLMCVVSALHVVIKERIVLAFSRLRWLALSLPFNYPSD